MISHGKDIKIFTGNANPALAQEICKIIGTKLARRRSRASLTARPAFPCMRPSAAATCSSSIPPASLSTTA